MSNDWLSNAQFGPLFHGTSKEFQPGDMVKPVTKKVAHATPHLYTARVFAGKDTPHVYEVEPVNPEETWTQKMKHTGRETHYETLSEHGFRVKAEVPKSRRESYYQK